MAGEVEMEMIGVEAVGVRAEYGGEHFAGATVYGAKERALALAAMPATFHGQQTTVGEMKLTKTPIRPSPKPSCITPTMKVNSSTSSM